MPGTEEASGFHLKGEGQGFTSRSNDIFGGLDLLAPCSQPSTSNDDLVKDDPRDEPISSSDQRKFRDCPTRYNRRRDDRQGPKDREGFQPPARRPPRSRRAPDHKQNPGKWTCYDLTDVSGDQLSERSNTAAAFDFLSERRKLQEAAATSVGEEEMEVGEAGNKHTFVKKTKETVPENEPEGTAPKFAAGKRVMAEYVVGGEKKSRQTPKTPESSMSNPDAVQLTYLDADEGSGEGSRTALVASGSKDGEKIQDSQESSQSEEGAVKFKSRKGKKRAAIRARHDDDEEEEEGKD